MFNLNHLYVQKTEIEDIYHELTKNSSVIGDKNYKTLNEFLKSK